MKLRNRWRKWFSLVLSCILLVISPVRMLADEMSLSEEVTIISSGNCGDSANYVLDSNGLVTISGTGTINLDVYEYYENVKYVVIESGITTLDTLALSEYVYLESVELPDTITSIGGWAFQFAAIKEIVLPDSVTILGEEAFTWCENLEKVVLSKNLTTIEDAAFWGCVSLTSLDIPVSVTSIGGAAFEYCDKLTDIYYEGTEEQWKAITMEAETIPENVTVHYAVSKQESTEESSKEVYTEEQFETLLEENAVADIIIESNDAVTITFGKGTMQKVEGQTSYDFTSTVSADYAEAKVPETVAKDAFVAKISFAYSGTLPAEATMKILVGTDTKSNTV